MGLLIITTLPSILILMYFVKGDKFPEPQDKILKTFFWGLAICLPAYIGNTLLFEVYRDLGISNILSSSFFGPAIIEEGLKFLVFLNIVYKFKDFDEPIDGIVYGVCISLGFAMLENIYYVYLRGGLGDPYAVALERSFTAVPAHAVFGAVMGINFSRYRFKKSKDKSYLTLALVVPYLLHGLYNFLIQTNYQYGLLLVLCGVIYVLKKYNDEIKLQKRKKN